MNYKEITHVKSSLVKVLTYKGCCRYSSWTKNFLFQLSVLGRGPSLSLQVFVHSHQVYLYLVCFRQGIPLGCLLNRNEIHLPALPLEDWCLLLLWNNIHYVFLPHLLALALLGFLFNFATVIFDVEALHRGLLHGNGFLIELPWPMVLANHVASWVDLKKMYPG